MKETASLMLRLPADVKGWVADQAQQSERSQNSQIVWLIRQAMETEERSRIMRAAARAKREPRRQ